MQAVGFSSSILREILWVSIQRKKPIPKFMNGEFLARRKSIPCRQLPVSVGSGDKETRRNRKKSIEGFLGQEGLRRLYRSMEAMLGAYTRRGYGRRVSPFREGFDQHQL